MGIEVVIGFEGEEKDGILDSDSSISSEEEESWEFFCGKKWSCGFKLDDDGFEIVFIEDLVKYWILDFEGFVLGVVIVFFKKVKRDFIDNFFNWYIFNEDEGEFLEWFV